MIDLTAEAVGWLTYPVLLMALAGCLLMLRREARRLNPENTRDWRKVGVRIYSVLLVPVWLIAFGAVGWTTATMFANPPLDADPLALRIHYLALVGFLGVLGGLITLPLSVARAEANERQTRASEAQVETALAQVEVAQQGQVTDRINKAVKGPGAEKTRKTEFRYIEYTLPDSEDPIRTRIMRDREMDLPEGARVTKREDWQTVEDTHANLEVRIGAIYALERIAQDSDRDHIRIMEILCAYIRQNAPATMAEKFPKDWADAFAADWDAEGVTRPTQSEIQPWARGLRKPRTDIQVALEVIGRRLPRQIALERAAEVRGSDVGYRLDLRDTCLQGADMAQMNFDHVQLERAHLQGAILISAGLHRANFNEAALQGADLRHAKLEGEHHSKSASLIGAQLQGANLKGAQLQSADLERAGLQRANLSMTNLQNAQLPNANLTQINETFGLNMSNASLSDVHLQWARVKDVQLQGASLDGAKLQGTLFDYTEFDAETNFRGANITGAALRNIDCRSNAFIQRRVSDFFGDGSVELGNLEKPSHWAKVELARDLLEPHGDPFMQEWRAYQRSIGMDPDNTA